MPERTLHDLLPDLYTQPLSEIQPWAIRQKLTRTEALILYRTLARRNDLEDWKVKVQLAHHLFALPGWTEEELRSELRKIFDAFGGSISFGREPDSTAYEIPHKLLWPKIKELELARWQQTYDGLALQDLFVAYRRELPNNEQEYVRTLIASKLPLLDAKSILTLDSFESHQDLRYRLRNALAERFGEISTDDLVVLLREKRYKDYRLLILSALSAQGWPIEEFQTLLAQRAQDKKEILQAISTRVDLPFELILMILEFRLASFGRHEFKETLVSVAPRLTTDQLERLSLAITDRQDLDWWFFSPIVVHWPMETQINLFRRIHHFPTSFFEAEGVTDELLLQLFEATDPEAEELADLARGIAKRSEKQRARAVA